MEDQLEKVGFRFFFDDSHVLNLELKPGYSPKRANVQQVVDVLNFHLKNEKNLILLADIRNLRRVSFQEIVFGDRQAISSTKATALLVHSPLTRLFGSFIINFTSWKTPIRMFSDREKALAWLKAHQ